MVPVQSRWDSQVADLGSAYKLAPQSPGLPQTVNFSARVSLLILRLREVSSLSVGNYIQFGRSHESDFHGITRFGSKICHRSVTCVTCDTCVVVCDSAPSFGPSPRRLKTRQIFKGKGNRTYNSMKVTLMKINKFLKQKLKNKNPTSKHQYNM